MIFKSLNGEFSWILYNKIRNLTGWIIIFLLASYGDTVQHRWLMTPAKTQEELRRLVSPRALPLEKMNNGGHVMNLINQILINQIFDEQQLYGQS